MKESSGVFNPRAFGGRDYPGGSLQYVHDQEMGKPFSRLFEQADSVTHIPGDRKIKLK